jgi:AraC family transcriptional regulator, regulatory protein of adaptative response / methylated-DNA-[protein]-cysteine methyltransferase
MQTYRDDESRWQAVLTRDKAADGVFFSAVRTMGVFCKPSCPGRPLRKNVIFYETAREAQQAGYRACKRCRPTG